MQVVSRWPILTTALALVAGAVFYSQWTSALEYDRAAVARGELWRLATCQWTHWSADHLLWDVVVFFALGVACERRGRRSFAWTVAIASVVVPIAVHLACPTLDRFRGLSGDCALFALIMTRIGGAIGAFAFVGFVVKTIDELVTGTPVFAASTFAVVPVSHLAGFVIGAGCGIVCRSLAFACRPPVEMQIRGFERRRR